MANSGRANPRSSTSVTVAVVGITSSIFGEEGRGAGKSCLCNRFVWPHADHYYHTHPYIVNYSEYGNSVINNTHFLYWGEKVTGLEDSSEVCFKVIEHTEFVEDMSLKPFHSQKSYHKRITVTKLQSSGKLQYVAPNQLTLPEEYTSVSRFPDRNVQVDGFILCIDASAPFEPKDIQHDMAQKLITSIQGTKKQFVIALTKCDVAPPGAITSITETLSKLKKVPQIIEVSSHEGVNVDLCFLTLTHLIDSRRPKSRVVSYEEGIAMLKQRIKRNETAFNDLLAQKLTDFTQTVAEVAQVLKLDSEWHGVAQFKGEARCTRLIQLRLNELKDAHVEKQSKIFLETLPEYLTKLLPNVSLTDTYEMCLELLRQHSQFDEYFVKVEDWRRNDEFIFSFSTKIPTSVLEEEGKVCVEEYISQLQLNQTKALAKMKIEQVLNDSNDLQPGIKVMVAMEKLGLTEEAELISRDVVQKMYLDRISALEPKYSEGIHELLLERLDLFHKYTPSTKELIEKLQDEPRMKVMEYSAVKRDGIILKHISNLEVLEHGPYYTPEIVTSLASTCPSLTSVQSAHEGHWSLDSKEDGAGFNLAILGMVSDETMKLRSDIMNACSGSDMYETSSKSYQLCMSCFNDSACSLTSEKFVPQGVVFVVSSIDSLEWVESICSQFFVSVSTAKYRGLPCVLLVVDNEMFDGKTDSDLYNQSKRLSTALQCVLVVTRPSELPGRLVTQDIVNNVLSSLFDVVSLTTTFLTKTPVLEEDGLNFNLFSLPGDPLDIPALTDSFSSQQLTYYDETKRFLYMKIALEKQHRIATLAFYSTINAKEIISHPVLGFILLYSAQRKASLAAVRWLIPRLPDIPVLLVAMTTDTSAPLLEEGEQLAMKWKKMKFVVCQKELEIRHISEFCSSCFFSRFTTWNSQGLSEEVVSRLCKRKRRQLPRGKPDIPTSSMTLPHSLSRHSIAVGLDDIRPSERLSAAVSKSPARSHYPQQPLPIDDDPSYTSPADIKKNTTSPFHEMKSHLPLHLMTQERKTSSPQLSRSGPRNMPQFGSLPRQHHASFHSDYVVVPDSEALSKLDTLTRGKGASFPSTDSPEEEEEEEALYANPRDTGSRSPLPVSLASRPPPIPPKEKLYDHLTPRSRRKLQENGIDISDIETLSNLNQVESVYSLAGVGRESPPPPVVYDGVGERDIYSLASEPEIHDVHSYTSHGGRGSTPPPPQQLYSYAAVQHNEDTPPDALYAEPIVRRDWRHSPSPPPLRGVSSNTPPPTCPPPRPPKSDVLNTRTASVRHQGKRETAMAPVRQSTAPQIIPHTFPDDENPDVIYALPTKPKTSSKVHLHTFHEATPPSGDLDDDDDDDEAPPLPERNYNWSDIEDDDEEVLYSDDDSSSQSSDLSAIAPIPVGIYATVTEVTAASTPLTLHVHSSPSKDMYRCSAEVEEMEVIYMNFNQLKRLTTIEYPNESIYDSLEKVVAAVNTGNTGAVSNTLPTTSMNTTPTMPPLSKNALKLMKKMEKKSQREAERRKKQAAKRRRKEEEETKKMERALKKGKKVKQKSLRKRYFESSLSSVVEEDGTPRLVKVCAAFVEKEGLETEGVYRVSGRKEDIMIIQEKFDQDPTVELETMDVCVNAVTGVLKNFFKLLPDPLIPESILPGLLNIPGQDLQTQKALMHRQLSALPKENLSTLLYLVNHLHVVQKNQSTNKMNASNLSIVFWPTLMRPPLTDLANPEKQLGFQLTMAKMIEHPDFVPTIL